MDPTNGGLMAISLSDSEDELSQENSDMHPRERKNQQSEAAFQAIRDEYKPKIENGDVCVKCSTSERFHDRPQLMIYLDLQAHPSYRGGHKQAARTRSRPRSRGTLLLPSVPGGGRLGWQGAERVSGPRRSRRVAEAAGIVREEVQGRSRQVISDRHIVNFRAIPANCANHVCICPGLYHFGTLFPKYMRSLPPCA